MYRERRKTIPKLPKCSDDALAMMKDRDIMTKMGEKFNYVSETGLIMYTCKENLDLLSKCKTVIIGGTFDRAPDHFAQLYTIHGQRVQRSTCILPFVEEGHRHVSISEAAHRKLLMSYHINHINMIRIFFFFFS